VTGNILRDWYKKVFSRYWTGKRSRRKKEKAVSFFRKWLRKNTRAVSVGSRARLNQTQNWSWNYFEVRNCLEFDRPNEKMFMRLIFLKNSTFPSLKLIVDTDWLCLSHRRIFIISKKRIFTDSFRNHMKRSGGSKPWAKEGERGRLCFACPAGFSSFCDFFFFYPK